MRTTILTSIIMMISFCVKAQSTQDTGDTIRYLRTSNEQFKTRHLGKPLNEFLNQLRYKPVTYDNVFDQFNLKDTIYQTAITLYFDKRAHSPDFLLHRKPPFTDDSPQLSFNIPYVTIIFKTPVLMLKKDVISNGYLTGDWTSQVASFWGPNIIRDIKVGERH